MGRTVKMNPAKGVNVIKAADTFIRRNGSPGPGYSLTISNLAGYEVHFNTDLHNDLNVTRNAFMDPGKLMWNAWG